MPAPTDTARIAIPQDLQNNHTPAAAPGSTPPPAAPQQAADGTAQHSWLQRLDAFLGRRIW